MKHNFYIKSHLPAHKFSFFRHSRQRWTQTREMVMKMTRVAFGKKMLVGISSANAALMSQSQFPFVILIVSLAAKNSALSTNLSSFSHWKWEPYPHFQGSCCWYAWKIDKKICRCLLMEKKKSGEERKRKSKSYQA